MSFTVEELKRIYEYQLKEILCIKDYQITLSNGLVVGDFVKGKFYNIYAYQDIQCNANGMGLILTSNTIENNKDYLQSSNTYVRIGDMIEYTCMIEIEENFRLITEKEYIIEQRLKKIENLLDKKE